MLVVATCQLPVSADVSANARHVRHWMRRAAERDARSRDRRSL